jgi:peptidoglycan/xylan/chitin deacetylase (PgdA/CDA1 family)
MYRHTAILAVLLWLLTALATPASAADRFLVVRYDDYAPVSAYTHAAEAGPEVPRPVDQTPEVEARLLDLFQRCHARIVVGVIPFPILSPADPPKSPDSLSLDASWLADRENPWVALLRQYVASGTIEPALHGYEHRRNTPPTHRPGEFGGQPATWQRDAIRRGRDALSRALDGPVSVFVPPWNSWDTATAAALDDLGFAWCSADAHHANYEDGGVRFIPQTASQPEQLLAFLRSGHPIPAGSILVLTTHPFDFTGPEGERYFQSLEQLLQYVDADPDWACVGLGDLPPAPLDQWHVRFRRAVAWSNTTDLARDMICLAPLAAVSPPLYDAAVTYMNRTLSWRLVIALVLLLAAAAGWLAGWLIARWDRRRWTRRAALLPALATVVLLAGAFPIASRGYHVRGIRWQVIAVAAGLSVGLALRPPRRAAASDSVE